MAQGPVTVTGTAEIGRGVGNKDTAVVYVVDASAGALAPGCGNDADGNGNGIRGTLLECEVAAMLVANEHAVATNVVSHAGVVVYGSTAVAADLSPADGIQSFVAPEADVDRNGTRDIHTVLGSIDRGLVGQFQRRTVGDGVNYGSAVNALKDVINTSTKPRKLVIFVATGPVTEGPTVIEALSGLKKGTRVYTFAVGQGVHCNDANPRGTLADLSRLTGAKCTEVADPQQLPLFTNDVLTTTLEEITVLVDGVRIRTPVTVTPPLPVHDTTEVTFFASPVLSTPGSHKICAEVLGSDFGGAARLRECANVIVGLPPVAVCSNATLVADGACHGDVSVNAGSFDPDGDLVGCTQTPAGPYGEGATGVTLTCTDATGATSSCAATITVVDQTRPALACPSPLELECTGNRSAAGTYQPVASDNCSRPSVTCEPTSGTVFSLGRTPVACKAVDKAANSDTCGFHVDVVDTTPPAVDMKQTLFTVVPAQNRGYRNFSLTECIRSASDACFGPVTLSQARVVRLTSDEPDVAEGDAGEKCRDVRITGRQTVSVRAERAVREGDDGRVYTIHFAIADPMGNESHGSCKVQVKLNDTAPPAVDNGCHTCVGEGCGDCPAPAPNCPL